MWSCQVAMPKHATPFNKAIVPSVSATSWRRRRGVSANASQQGGNLGQALLATVQSDSTPVPIPKPQHEGEINGSDVLWALQRASARKKKKKNKKEHRTVSSSATTPAVDYTNVRPLRINANWAAKLDELDKRLRQLSDTI
ncbi:hypothetical protein Fmac_007231 [Flemingia macrophylla]|uniref:Uncharacterized protein n=1 Tax=Flemingia macrophylla TaxID=520843 RepID=A0ABD1NDB6_9FABA